MVYADDNCPFCNTIHHTRYHIQSSIESQLIAETLCDGMVYMLDERPLMTSHIPYIFNLNNRKSRREKYEISNSNVPRKACFMIGVLIASNEYGQHIYISKSGNDVFGSLLFYEVARRLYPHAKIINESKYIWGGSYYNKYGYCLSREDINSLLNINNNCGYCAALKLLTRFFKKYGSDPRNFEFNMSEVFFNPNDLVLGRETPQHRKTAESCSNCKKLLPFLMCPDVAGYSTDEIFRHLAV